MTANDPTILILGSAGRVGIEVVRYLLRQTNYQLILANRTAMVSDTVIQGYQERVERVNFDVTDSEQLEQWCNKADLLIACVGPSNVIGSIIADACRKTSTVYVDAGGYDPLLAHLDTQERIEPSTVPLVINVGLLPGLSGMFPAYLLNKYLNDVHCERLDVHYVGRDAWSYNSAWDIVYGLGDFGQERGFCHMKDGKMVKVPFTQAKGRARFAEPIGEVATMLIYAEELRRLADRYGITNLNVFGANIGLRAVMVCLIAKVLGWYKSPKTLARAARWLAKASKKDMQKREPFYGISSTAYFSDGRKAEGELTLSDTYQATGIIIGIVGHYLIMQKNIAAGVYLLHDAVPPEQFMAMLKAENIITVHTAESISDARIKEA